MIIYVFVKLYKKNITFKEEGNIITRVTKLENQRTMKNTKIFMFFSKYFCNVIVNTYEGTCKIIKNQSLRNTLEIFLENFWVNHKDMCSLLLSKLTKKANVT